MVLAVNRPGAAECVGDERSGRQLAGKEVGAVGGRGACREGECSGTAGSGRAGRELGNFRGKRRAGRSYAVGARDGSSLPELAGRKAPHWAEAEKSSPRTTSIEEGRLSSRRARVSGPVQETNLPAAPACLLAALASVGRVPAFCTDHTSSLQALAA
ncbi:hypothetical protein NDU88_001320 [Pleurodeles waltl]|uniref:Uncharacterized protein n=1 Tax=Pleurodeles waltl TaxID=8319 RepID=A0AAV7S890_PLEWA|nr:hypothetical protein NDU88_001320 [Pleurodeles waltl]